MNNVSQMIHRLQATTAGPIKPLPKRESPLPKPLPAPATETTPLTRKQIGKVPPAQRLLDPKPASPSAASEATSKLKPPLPPKVEAAAARAIAPKPASPSAEIAPADEATPLIQPQAPPPPKVETAPETENEIPFMDVKKWQEYIQSMKNGEYITAEVQWSGGQKILVPIIEKNSLFIPRCYHLRRLHCWYQGNNYQDPILDAIDNTSFAAVKCMEQHMSRKYNENTVTDADLNSLEETLNFSQQLENDDILKSKLGFNKLYKFRKAVAAQLLTVLIKAMGSPDKQDRAYALWRKALNNYQVIWVSHRDPQNRLAILTKMGELYQLQNKGKPLYQTKSATIKPPRGKENPLLDPFLAIDLKDWLQKVKSIEKGGYISSEVKWINKQRTLVPVVNNSFFSFRFYTLRRLIRWIRGGDYRDYVLEGIRDTAHVMLKGMDHHMERKYDPKTLTDNDLDSLEDTLDFCQQIENDSVLKSEMSYEQLLSFRKAIADQLLTVLKKEMEASADLPKERLIKIRDLWQKSLLNYRLIWQCHRDPEKRLKTINKVSEAVERQIEKLERMEKKAAALNKLHQECRSVVEAGQKNLKALEALEAPYKKLTTTQHRDKEIFDRFLAEYRAINNKMAAFYEKLKTNYRQNPDDLSEEKLDNLVGSVSALYENEFAPLMLNFQNIMYYHRPFTHLLEEGPRFNSELTKEWWNRLDDTFRNEREMFLADQPDPIGRLPKKYIVPPAFGKAAAIYRFACSEIKVDTPDIGPAIEAFKELAKQNEANMAILAPHTSDKKIKLFYENYEKTDKLLQDFKNILYKMNYEKTNLTNKEWLTVKFRFQQLMENYEVLKAYHRQLPKPLFPFETEPLPSKVTKLRHDYVKLFTPALPFLEFYQSYAAPLCRLKELLPENSPNYIKLDSCINKLFPSDVHGCKPRVLSSKS